MGGPAGGRLAVGGANRNLRWGGGGGGAMRCDAMRCDAIVMSDGGGGGGGALR